MDFEQLKKDVKEIAEVAGGVPEQFRDRTFDLLLTEYLRGSSVALGRPESPLPSEPLGEHEAAEEPASETTDDISVSDLHTKTKKFLKDNGLTLTEVNELFYKEGDEILPLYEDLGTTQLSESQLRIALLQAFRHALPTGDFQFSGEAVRTEAKQRKAYDMPNFATNFKSHAKNFDGFEKYDKKSPNIRLSPAGKKRLASLIKEVTSSQ